MQQQNALNPRTIGSIWILAWPVLINIGSHTLFSVIDLYWVHNLGTEAVAAVALDGNIIFCMFGLTQIMYTGTLVMVSHRIGARKIEGEDGAASVATQGFQLSLVLGLLIAGTGALTSAFLISLFDVNESMTGYAVDYLEPMMWSFLPLFPSLVIAAIFSANGDTRTPMYIAVFSNVLNAILDPFLIFGWWEFPELGVAGAGIATLICEIIGLVIIILTFKYKSRAFRADSLWKFKSTKAWSRLLSVGIPSGLAAITRPLSTLFLLKVIATFGAEGVAAFGITVRALSLLWICHGALATAVSTLTGRSIGEQDMEGIQVLRKNSITISLIASLVLGVLYWVFSTEVIRVFEKDNAEVIILGVMFLKLMLIANLSAAPGLVWSSIMVGAGETKSPMRIAIYANWIIKLPLAWFLAMPLGMGIEGIWYAMFISIVYENIAIYLAYRTGKWRKVKV